MMEEQAAKKGVELTNYYMIGDNPKSDIAGGNAKNMTTILVKTGVFNPEDKTSEGGNDREHPASFVVDSFKEAIELIWKREQL